MESSDRTDPLQQLLDASFDEIPVLLAYLTPEFDFVRVNRAYAAADGKLPDYFVGKNHFALFPNPENERIFTTVRETGQAFRAAAKPFEYAHNPERGVSHWDWTLTPVLDDQGRVLMLVLALVDVTVRIEALEAVARSEAELARERNFSDAVIACAGVLVVVLDAHGRIRRFNNACEQLSGYSADEMHGRFPWGTFLPPENADRIREEAFERVLSGAVPSPASYTNEWVTKRGERRLIEWTNTIIGNPNEPGTHMVSIGVDVTDRKFVEEKLANALRDQVEQRTQALRLAKEEAERANRAKSDFLAHMSHELRTPLNAILGFAQVLQHRLSSDDRQPVDEIVGAGQHLRALIEDLLDLSQVESGRLSMGIETIRLADLVQEALGFLGPEAVLETRMPPDITVRADRRRLLQALLNLLSNAVKFGRQGGRVLVVGEPLGDWVRTSVRDEGPGIGPEGQARLFRPFERLEGSTAGGTGIGLALSKRLVEAMGGRIGLESQRGAGSTFWIDLPRGVDAPGATVAQTPRASSIPAGTTILYIEDNPVNLRVVQAMLHLQRDVQVFGAQSVSEGLEQAVKLKPDVILLDLQLGDRTGYEVLDALRENPATSSIPVVALTAAAMSNDRERSFLAGIRAHLVKPVRLDELTATIVEALRKQKS